MNKDPIKLERMAVQDLRESPEHPSYHYRLDADVTMYADPETDLQDLDRRVRRRLGKRFYDEIQIRLQILGRSIPEGCASRDLAELKVLVEKLAEGGFADSPRVRAEECSLEETA